MSNIRWVGGAVATKQVSTLTVANTWAAADTAVVTIGNKDLRITIGTAVTVTDVAAEIAASINAASVSSPTPGAGYSRNIGGQEIPEFVEVIATALVGVVTVTAVNPGIPFTLTASETTAGTGTLTAATPTAATGPNWLSNPDNYAGGALPVDNDVLYFDQGSTDCLYDLGYFRTNAIDLDIYISNDWTGQLGLPPYNVSGGYPEYRQRYFYGRVNAKTVEIIPGLNGNITAGAVYLDFQSSTTNNLTIRCGRTGGSTPSIFVAGVVAGTTRVMAGAVAFEPDDSGVGAGSYFATAALIVGVPNGSASDCYCYFGRNANLATGTSIAKFLSGTSITRNQFGDGINDNEIEVRGGVLQLEDDSTNAYPRIDVYDGAILYPAGKATITLLRCYGGTVDFRRGSSLNVVTASKIYAGSTVWEKAGTAIQEMDLVGCSPNDCNLNMAPNRKWTFTSTAAA